MIHRPFLRPKASSLVVVLIVLGILFAVGGWFLATRLSHRQAAQEQYLAMRAESLARSGLEDARAKLSRDQSFPPSRAHEQKDFSYTEQLTDSRGQLYGEYRVQIDFSRAEYPTYVIRVNSRGLVGSTGEEMALRTVYAEYDLCPFDRTDPSRTNPFLGTWTYFEDRS